MPDWLVNILVSFWGVLSEMAPYLLFGFFAAGVLSVFIKPELVERHLGGRGFWASVKAAAFGVPLPLCSCGVIPVSASLRRHGAGRGPTIAFLISTPQTGVDSIFVTYSLLGGVFAIFRPIVALVSGVIGGWIVSLTERDGEGEARPVGTGAAGGPADAAAGVAGERAQCYDSCCQAGVKRPSAIWRAFVYGFDALPRDIGRAALIGLAIAALISALIPKNYFADLLPPGIGQILVLMLAGIPVYVCATASVPVAFALIHAGVSPGAAFAFLMTGPATNAATLAVVWKVLGRRSAIVYLTTMAVTAVAGGLLLDQLVAAGDIMGEHGMHWMMPDWVQAGSAIVLLAVLLTAVVRRTFAGMSQAAGEARYTETKMQEVRLTIAGMTCSHCVASVRKALLEQQGVADAQVSLKPGLAVVHGQGLDAERLVGVVGELGYTAAEEPPPNAADA